MPMQYITQSVFAVLCSPFLTPSPRDTKGWSRRASPNGKWCFGTATEQARWLSYIKHACRVTSQLEAYLKTQFT